MIMHVDSLTLAMHDLTEEDMDEMAGGRTPPSTPVVEVRDIMADVVVESRPWPSKSAPPTPRTPASKIPTSRAPGKSSISGYKNTQQHKKKPHTIHNKVYI